MGAEEALFLRFGKEVPKGTLLFREGELGKEMFVLQSGKVAISKKVRDVANGNLCGDKFLRVFSGVLLGLCRSRRRGNSLPDDPLRAADDITQWRNLNRDHVHRNLVDRGMSHEREVSRAM